MDETYIGPSFHPSRGQIKVVYEGRFYVRREVDLMKTAKVNAYWKD